MAPLVLASVSNYFNLKADDFVATRAGIIMFLAFGAILFGTTPVLQQIAFMLSIGVLIDCLCVTAFKDPIIDEIVRKFALGLH